MIAGASLLSLLNKQWLQTISSTSEIEANTETATLVGKANRNPAADDVTVPSMTMSDVKHS